MTYTTTRTGARIVQERHEPQRYSGAHLAYPYCTAAGHPDSNPPPKGSRASLLKAEVLWRRLSAGAHMMHAAKAEMLTQPAAWECLRQEGYPVNREEVENDY